MKTAVIIPNWNGEDFLGDAIDSLLKQTSQCTPVVVDNGSHDRSREIIESYGGKIVALYNKTNLGFTGGVNKGIKWALEQGYEAVALLNNDAVADTYWLESLERELKPPVGMVTSCIMTMDRSHIDTTGDQMTVWGLPYPRNRDTPVKDNRHLGKNELIFSASGGATLYSADMLRKTGIFDNDFFAYYEDVDLSFRAQLAGYKILYIPRAVVYHRINATSRRMKNGFMTYQSFKNMPMVLLKNLPKGLKHRVWPRFWFAYTMFFFSALTRGEGWSALKGFGKFISLIPKKLRERKRILKNMQVTSSYILDIMTHDLPENAHKLRKIRGAWWKIRGKE